MSGAIGGKMETELALLDLKVRMDARNKALSTGCGAEWGIMNIDVPAVLPTTYDQGRDIFKAIFTPVDGQGHSVCGDQHSMERKPHPHNHKRSKVIVILHLHLYLGLAP